MNHSNSNLFKQEMSMLLNVSSIGFSMGNGDLFLVHIWFQLVFSCLEHKSCDIFSTDSLNIL